MKTGFRGTFAINWAQTEVDGQRGASPSALHVGAQWRWSGEAVRVDGPAGVLPLGLADGEAELRRRATASLRRLMGSSGIDLSEVVAEEDPMPLWDRYFVVTDGRDTWEIGVVSSDTSPRPLLVFSGDIPPLERDLWVVRLPRKLSDGGDLGQSLGGIICFTPGTRILTERGLVAVQDIRVGDRVQTKDNGYDHVHWTGQKQVSGARLFAMPHLAPVLMRPGSLREGVPDEGLLVSPDHRVVLRGPRAQEAFGADEVLVAARDLVNDTDVIIDHSVRAVTYHHLLLSQHQIVFANGVETESFHPASAAFATMGIEDRDRLFADMPNLRHDPLRYGDTARRVLTQSEATILLGVAAR